MLTRCCVGYLEVTDVQMTTSSAIAIAAVLLMCDG
jgi:hypothetical protein